MYLDDLASSHPAVAQMRAFHKARASDAAPGSLRGLEALEAVMRALHAKNPAAVEEVRVSQALIEVQHMG
jgi:hypothetical protein